MNIQEYTDIIEDNEIIMENLITYCDNMMIAEEGFLESIKNGIKKALLTILNALKRLFSKGKDNKIKSKIRELIDKARRALGEVDEIETQEDANNLKDKAEEIKKETEKVQEEIKKEANPSNKTESSEDTRKDATPKNIDSKQTKDEKNKQSAKTIKDDKGRVIEEIDSDGGKIKHEYWGDTNVERHIIIDTKRFTCDEWYDKNGKLIEHNPPTRKSSSQSNSFSRKVTMIDGDKVKKVKKGNREFTYRYYGTTDKIKSVTGPDGAKVWYDKDGEIKKRRRANGKIVKEGFIDDFDFYDLYY